jgi:hypothetical protein
MILTTESIVTDKTDDCCEKDKKSVY